jgi:hypothetical protein
MVTAADHALHYKISNFTCTISDLYFYILLAAISNLQILISYEMMFVI